MLKTVHINRETFKEAENITSTCRFLSSGYFVLQKQGGKTLATNVLVVARESQK